MLKLRDSSVNGHNNFLWLDKPKSMSSETYSFLSELLQVLYLAQNPWMSISSPPLPPSLYFLWYSATLNTFFCPSQFPFPLSFHHFLFLSLSVSLAVPQAISDGLLRSSGRTFRQNRKLTSWACPTQGGCRTVTMTACDICILLLLLLLLIWVLFWGLEAMFIKGEDVNRTQCLDEICQPLNAAGQKELRMNEVSPQVVFFLKVLSALKCFKRILVCLYYKILS